MVLAVVFDSVAPSHDLARQRGVPLDPLADTEESGLRRVLI